MIDSYVDAAEGVLEKGADGRVQMTKITLKPKVTWSGDKRPSAEDIEALHHKSHEACFIANSVKADVVVEAA